MKSQETLERILRAKEKQLEETNMILNSTTDWLKAHCFMETYGHDSKTFDATLLAYYDAHIRALETQQAIKVLNFVLENPTNKE